MTLKKNGFKNDRKRRGKQTNCSTYLNRFLRQTFVAIPEQSSIVEDTSTQSIKYILEAVTTTVQASMPDGRIITHSVDQIFLKSF